MYVPVLLLRVFVADFQQSSLWPVLDLGKKGLELIKENGWLGLIRCLAVLDINEVKPLIDQ